MSLELIAEGRALLKRGRWKEAKAAFEQALKTEESAETLEGLAMACSWLSDSEGVVKAREQAFRLYQKAGDERSAARVAIWLANEFAEFRGEPAVANGWLQHAERLVKGMKPCEEQALVLTISAFMKLMMDKDPAGARALAAEGRAIAVAVNSIDCIMITNALEGMAMVSEGEVKEGMRLLDEATATAVGGACENLNFVGSACCLLIAACERVRDFERAAQWCEHVKAYSRRWRMGSLFAVCRTQYSAVLISKGDWLEAEEELISATEELNERRPALVGTAMVRLAELRRRQGRFEEAKKLFRGAEYHLLSLLGLSMIACDENEVSTSAEFAQRFLRRIPPSDRIERIPGLETLIRAYAGAGEAEKAEEILAELLSIVGAVSTAPLQAAGRFAEGIFAGAKKQPGVGLTCFEDAVDLYEKACMPFESATARIELAGALQHMHRNERAQLEARTARDQAEKLGASFLVRRAEALIQVPQHRTNPALPHNDQEQGLTPRETEILQLVAEGKDNSRIADELFLSVRTVERHISNTYQKLGITGKAARTVATAYALKNLPQVSR